MAADNEGPRNRSTRSWWPPSAMRAAFAEGMATGMQDYELLVAERKKRLFSMLKEDTKLVLDVGVGAGPNLAYLPSNVTCVGLDPNEFMDKYAHRKAAALVTRGIQLNMVRGKAEDVPFADNTFDAVISTLTLCSEWNPQKALSEIQRVLAPGGSFIFLEHVRAKDDPGLRLAQTLLNPFQVLLADGCNLNRDTARLIRQEGTSFDTIEVEEFNADLGFAGSLISRQISGIAVKKA